MAESDRERPILFSGEMVKAIIDGRKTQTRRVVKPQPTFRDVAGAFESWVFEGLLYPNAKDAVLALCPYGAPHDQLWVRENGWQRPERSARDMREGADTWAPYYYDADGYTNVDGDQFKAWGFKRRPSIHMPRWASRITLEITGVRVERLQDISHIDAIAEGVQSIEGAPLRNERLTVPQVIYAHLWDKINGAGAWDENPWVWVVEFKRQ